MKHKNLLYLSLILLLLLLPLWLHRNGGEDRFSGADGKAVGTIAELAPNYKPWMKPLFQPPSGEFESLLFAIQAAVGAGFIGYTFGVLRERRRHQKQESKGDETPC